MLHETAIVKNSSFQSPLASTSTLNPDKKRQVRSLVAGVILTSLVDAFSILVIYLLVNYTNSGEFMNVGNDLVLPDASYAATLERATIVKVLKDHFFIEDSDVAADQLVAELLKRKQNLAKSQIQGESNDALIIQADKNIKYNVLNQVVQASSHAGFSEVRFAVITN